MADIMLPIEEVLSGIAPLLLAVPGAVLVLAGLFLWLGGLRLLKPLAVFVAAGAGLTCALIFTDRQLVPLLCFTLIPAAIGLFLEKPIVAALGGVMAAAVVLIWPYFADASLRQAVSDRIGPAPSFKDQSVLKSLDTVEQLAEWSAKGLKTCWEVLPKAQKAIAAGVFVSVFVVGVFAWRWVCAMTCSMLGTVMIVSGMFLVLLSKGTQAIKYVTDRMPYLAAAVAAMIIFGILINRWLCPAKVKTKPVTETQPVQGDKK